MKEKKILTALFREVCKYGYVVRKTKIDGKKAWNNIEKMIANNNVYLGGWNYLSYKFYNDLLNLGVIEEMRPDIAHNTWLYHHFLLQHGRLSKKECYLNRLLQIAYNAGQLAYCLRHSEGSLIYTYDRILYYVTNNLNSIDSYINIDNIKFKSETISNLEKLIVTINQSISNIK
jgi:hypothetical protein